MKISLRYLAFLTLVVLVLGCESGDPLPASATLLSSPTTEASPSGTSDPTSAGPNGQLAYIGVDGNVYVTTAAGEETIAVTDDATAAPELEGMSYHRLAWSPDGRLAFASVTRSGSDARGALHVADSPEGPIQTVGQSDDHFIIYVYWAPVPCPTQPMCRRLAYLVEEEDGVGLHVVEMRDGQVDDQLVGVGRPFYFSWAPDGRQILWHSGGARRFRPEARIALYDVVRDRIWDLPEPPGLFHAPAWSPGDTGWLGVVANNGADQLQNLLSVEHETDTTGQPLTLTAAPNRRMAFTWSPSGDKIAYAVQENVNDAFYGPIHVYDVNADQSRRVTIPAFDISAFFWSPDGQRIAYLSRLQLPDAVWMQWRVYDVVRGLDRGFEAFHPSPLMRFMIHSFNQYAQSHRFWSPDGRYLVYAERDRRLVDRVWLVDTWAEKGTDPILVDRGSIGVWSW